jgi:hypothetical protein
MLLIERLIFSQNSRLANCVQKVQNCCDIVTIPEVLWCYLKHHMSKVCT